MRVGVRSWRLGALLAVTSMALGQTHPEAGNLTVTVEGLLPKTGLVRVALFQSADGFPGNTNKAFSITRAAVTSSRETLTFENIPYGSYAISVYQDLNKDHRLNKSFFGIPKEPVGFSNDPPMRKGPPHFEDAVFLFKDPSKTAMVHLRTR